MCPLNLEAGLRGDRDDSFEKGHFDQSCLQTEGRLPPAPCQRAHLHGKQF